MRPIDMAEFVGEEPISVGVDEPITLENKTDTAFDVDCGIVFRKSGLYRVSIVGGHMSVAVEPERKTGKWVDVNTRILPDKLYKPKKCSNCGKRKEKYVTWNYCPNCGAKMEVK